MRWRSGRLPARQRFGAYRYRVDQAKHGAERIMEVAQRLLRRLPALAVGMPELVGKRRLLRCEERKNEQAAGEHVATVKKKGTE